MRKFTLLSLALLLFIFPASAQDEETLRIGYIPIMVMEQHFVITDQGWYDELSDFGITDVEATRFSSGAPIVQAFAGNELDIAYVGINPALVMASRGVPITVVASNVTNALTFIANDDFSAIWAETPSAEAFAIYEEQVGNKLRVATLPQGTTPDTVLRLWLNQIGATGDEIEIIPLGVDQVQVALATGNADASLIMEPVISLAESQDWGFSTLVTGAEILADQPGAVLIVRDSLIEENPDLVEKLVELHIRATIYASSDLDEAARIASEQIGDDILSIDIARIASEELNWISSPYSILESTRAYNDFQVALEVFDEPVDLDVLFDTSFYDAVIEANPDFEEALSIEGDEEASDE